MSTAPNGFQTPKLDWSSSNVPLPVDFNRIEGNINAIETGNRTVDPAQVPTSNTGTIRQFLDWFSNRLKTIAGTTNWWDTITESLSAVAQRLTSHQNAAAPHSGHETPSGAQAKVDSHATATQTHGASGSYRLAKTSRTDQLPAWGDIPDKPSTYTPSAHKSTHASGGSDALTPSDIGAVAKAGDTMTGALQFNDANTKLLEGSSNAVRVQTNSGYIDIGPQNTSYGHIYTDRASFYFNKDLLVNGNKVWHAGNDGAGSGLDADAVDSASVYVASDNVLLEANTERTYTASASFLTPTVFKQFRLNYFGTIRVKVDAYGKNSTLYILDLSRYVGPTDSFLYLQSTTLGTSYTTCTFDISGVYPGMVIAIGIVVPINITAGVKNAKVCGSPGTVSPAVVLD